MPIEYDICIVDVDNQTMDVQCGNGFNKQFKVSTAENGVGNESGSFKTPLGKHSVCEKIGDGAPILTIFKSRQDTGFTCKTLNVPVDEDLILTRILRLKGEESGVNSGHKEDGTCIDSYERYIYIHGTNREDLLGTPASHGCIRMGNDDIVELFPNIRVGATVDMRSSKATLRPSV